MAFEPVAEKLNQKLLGTTFFAAHALSKGLRSAHASPGFREHMNLRHCAVRVVSFASPAKRNPAPFIAECDALSFDSAGIAAGWTSSDAAEAILAALGTDQINLPFGPLVPGVRSLMTTIESVLDAVARQPELEAALSGVEFSLELMQIPLPFGRTGVFRMVHAGSDVQWTYRQRREYQAPDPALFRTGMVIKSTRIPAAVFSGHAGLWRDSMRHLIETDAA